MTEPETTPSPPAEPPLLPRWDVSTFFPGLGSRAWNDAEERLGADLDRLGALYEQHGVRAVDPPPEGPLAPATVAAFDEVLAATNDVMAQVRLLGAYLHAFVSTDAADDDAAGRQSAFQARTAGLATLTKRLEQWVAHLGADRLAEASAHAADHRFWLERARTAAEHQMSEAEEDLAAELRLTGSGAWARLHRDITARLTVEVPVPHGGRRRLAMSQVRGLATDPDPALREAAYRAELDAWEGVAVPLAAALNGAKGEHAALNRRRGWDDDLAPALFANNVDAATLGAMTDAVTDALGDFRRYLRAKHRWLTGKPGGLRWFDLLAPVRPEGGRVGWDEAVSTVRSSFATYAPSLAGLVDRATDERWIDAEPRPGKVGGAFCLPVRGTESRVLMNFDGSFDSLQTLAHELGHAYHNTQLGTRTPLQRQTPMALAETASIFCETVVVEALLAGASDEERLVILDTDLQGSCMVVTDIRSRFTFERELCQRRRARTLGVAELCELMLAAQEAAYGDGLDPDVRHPYMWAVKGHYFTPFYNWPYTFGLLFGIGLFARYRDDPERFRHGYDDLLASTGVGDATTLAARFAIDVRSPSFWAASLDVLRARIEEFVRLTADRPPAEEPV